MRIGGGFILQPRAFDESDIASASPCVREIWFYLIRNANSKDSKYKGFEIKRGQLFRSYQDIRDGLSWKIGYRTERYSEAQTKDAMRQLRKTGRITTMKQPRGVLITICKYDIYQTVENYEATDEATDEATTKLPPINKNNKNNKKDNKKETYKEKISDSDVDEVYKAYPTKCPIKKRRIEKSSNDKAKIKKLLEKGQTKEGLLSIIQQYVNNCTKDRVYMKNFGTFLNNLPDYGETELPVTIGKIFTERYSPYESLSDNGKRAYYDKDSVLTEIPDDAPPRMDYSSDYISDKRIWVLREGM